jgi:hypothetical protein
MINSDEIIYGTKIRNAHQIQNFLGRNQSGIANENQKRITAGTQLLWKKIDAKFEVTRGVGISTSKSTQKMPTVEDGA